MPQEDVLFAPQLFVLSSLSRMSCAASSRVVVFGLMQQKQTMAPVSPLEGRAAACRTGGPGEHTVGIVLEGQTAGASRRPLRPMSHLLCLALRPLSLPSTATAVLSAQVLS